MADDTDLTRSGEDTSRVFDKLSGTTRELSRVAGGFASIITRAFATSITSGKQFDDVLKSLTLKASDLAVKLAFKPLEGIVSSGIGSLVGGVTGGIVGSVKPFASGGVIGSPTYFPLGGDVGLAGEAGPEAIMPLKRGPDGRLGVAAGASGGNSVVVNIATPDADSFRRSETYIAGQIARAVARGRRSL